MVYPQIVVRNCYDKTTALAASDLRTLWTDAGRWMFGFDHCYLAPSIVFGPSWLHFINFFGRDLFELHKIESDLR